MPSSDAPVCSIVIPTRDCLAYLPTAFASIDLQRLGGLEVIVADDGSRDGTVDWLQAAPRVHASLVILETGGNGPARARNAAIAAARSELVAFLDADDYWWPDKLARQLAFHRMNRDVGFSFTDYIHVTPDGRTHGTCFEFWGGVWGETSGAFSILADAEARLLAANVVGTSCVVARKSCLEAAGGFETACKSAEDWDLWLRMAARNTVASSTMMGMTYLMRPNSETAARQRRMDAMNEIVARYDADPRPAIAAARKLARARLTTAEAESLSAQGRPLAAAMRHFSAMRAAPSRRGAKAALAGIVQAARTARRSGISTA
ncbi:MAG: glycosyltransferase family A protein [Hyphomicrobiaceae bacterium]